MARIIYLVLLPNDLFYGMGGQIWPGYTGTQYGMHTKAFDTAAVPVKVTVDGRSARWARANPDFDTYVEPIKSALNCLKQRNFRNSCCLLNLCEYRLPGFGVIYSIIRSFYTSSVEAWDMLIWIQVILGAAASVLFGELVGRLTGKKLMICVGSISYAFFPYVVRYEFILGSEGMYHSFIIFYAFFLYLSSLRPNFYLFISSFSLLLAFLFRPITILFYLPTFGAFLVERRDFYKKSLILFLPFLAFEAFWIPCNFIRNKSIYPFSSTLYLRGIGESEWGRVNFLLSSYGDNYYWFYYSNYTFPKRSFTSKFDSVRADSVKAIVQKFYRGSGEVTEKDVVRLLLEWEQSIKEEKPLLYHLYSRIYAVWNFITSHLQEHLLYTPITEGSTWYFILYVYSMMIWIFAVFVGGIACIYYLWKFRQNIFYAVLSLNALLGIASYSYLKQIQSRYLLISIPLLLTVAFVFTYDLYRRYVTRSGKGN
ncbi:MAG: hypothetical protein NZ989_03245 [Bacteroidia bacterium]|nr:hypothetical protein [Bacteroidia bacterium]MDW8057354.1 hypothetical protein [Bacteroidia bacterium]